MAVEFFKGRVINHSSKWLLVIETTTYAGRSDKPPALVHKLGPKRKTPSEIDADGFKRLDTQPIDGHKDWWKIKSLFTADVYDNAEDLKICLLYKSKVKDPHFGDYEVDESDKWGDNLKYVTGNFKNKKGKTIGYHIEGYGRVSVLRGVELAEGGHVDNAVVVNGSQMTYLRTKPDGEKWNNLVDA